MKRATTRAVQIVGRMVAAVYRNGGVTRREAMVSCCDHGNLRQENQIDSGMRRIWHRRKNILLVGIECYRMPRNKAERYSDRHSIRT